MPADRPEPEEAPKSELDQMTEFLERIFKMPLESDYVRGTATVLSIGEPPRRGRFVACDFRAVIAAEGIEPVEADLEYMVRRDVWPTVGQVLPTRVLTTDPVKSEVLWELLG